MDMVCSVIQVGNTLGSSSSLEILVSKFISARVVFKSNRYKSAVVKRKCNFFTVLIQNGFINLSLICILNKPNIYNGCLCMSDLNDSFSVVIYPIFCNIGIGFQ